MFDFKIEHLLLFVVAIFLLYHLLGGCGCANWVIDGFSVGVDNICYVNCCGLSSSDCNEKKKDLSYVNCNKIDTLNNKVDTITNRLDELICELVQSEKCITDQGVSDCKNK